MVGCAEPQQHVADVELAQLEPLTMLPVWTWHSVYRLVVLGRSAVMAQRGPYVPELTHVRRDGTSAGGHFLKSGWSGVGHLMALRGTEQLIVTSPVVAVSVERRGVRVAH